MNPHELAARRLVDAVAARDADAITEALAPDARFRYLIPPGPGEVVGAAAVAATFLQWFGDADVLAVESIHIEALADRMSARYRFRLTHGQAPDLVEQHTFLDVDEHQRVATIDLLCSGFRPAGEATEGTSGVHEFDAGELGCADGLAQEFRRRILAIPLGELLLVQTSDPAAKQDLPPLARLMGHRVRSIEPAADGRLAITVERGR